jgi:TfoX/Sxy family transcriptional regulator of competence genes
MAYDEKLAQRIRTALKGRRGPVEKKMFGGLAYLSNGKMFAGILKDELVVRVGPEANDHALKERHTRPMDFTGRPMKGYIFVSPDGIKTAAQLHKWLTRGQTFVASLYPAKRKTAHRASRIINHQPRRTSS